MESVLQKGDIVKIKGFDDLRFIVSEIVFSVGIKYHGTVNVYDYAFILKKLPGEEPVTQYDGTTRFFYCHELEAVDDNGDKQEEKIAEISN